MRRNHLTLATCPPVPSFEDACARFRRRCEAKALSPKTILYYGFHLTALSRYLNAHAPEATPADVTTDLLRGFIADRTKVSATTAHHSLLTVRVFFKFLAAEGIVPTNPADGLDAVRRKQPLIPDLPRL